MFNAIGSIFGRGHKRPTPSSVGGQIRLAVERLEERLHPSWGSVPPLSIAPSSRATAVQLNADGDVTVSGAITSNEVDWFRLVAPKAGSYLIRTDNSLSGIDTVVGVYGASGARLAYNNDMNPPDDTFSGLALDLNAGQTCLVGVTNHSGTPGGAYRMTIDGPTLEDAFEDNDTLATATELGLVTARTKVNALALMDSADWFRFSIVQPGFAGHSVSITFLNRLGNLNLQLYDFAGKLLASSSNGTNTESISLSGRAAGVYFLKVFGHSATTSNAEYSLTINPPLPDDQYEGNDTRAAAHNLGMTTTATTLHGLRLADPADWFKFTTVATGGASEAVRIDVAPGTGNVNLQLYSSTGALLATSAGISSNGRISLSGRSAGTYFIRVYGHDGVTSPEYKIAIVPPPKSEWYRQSLADADIRGLAESLNEDDGRLSRADMLQIFEQTKVDDMVSKAEWNDLRLMVTNTNIIGMTEPVRVLSKKVILGNRANAKYQGATLGNLATGSNAAQLQKLVNKWFLGLDRPIADANTTYVFAEGSLFGPTIRYEDVNQGQTADCYLLAALGAVALQDSSKIEQMFIDNGDNTFIVRFFCKGLADYVTVDRYFPADGGQFWYANMGAELRNAANVLWVAMAEKAYVQWNESGLTGQENAVNTYVAIEAGFPNAAATQISGKNVSWAGIAGLTFGRLHSEFDSRSYVMFCSRTSVRKDLVPYHAYTMVDHNVEDQTVTLFNPWGVSGGWYGGSWRSGLVTLKMTELLANFGWWYW